MKQKIRATAQWIASDWHSHPLRFAVETLCWLLSLACAVTVNLTVPNPPWSWLYPMWISGTLAYAWCAWSRGSSGMTATFVMLALIDLMGAIRWFLS